MPPPRCLAAMSLLDASLPIPRVLVRVKFPGFLGTIKALRLPAVPPAALRFLRLAVPREHACFAPGTAAWGSVAGLGLVTRYPHPGFLRGDDRISQVPGDPRFPSAHVLRPRPVETFQTDYGTLAWPPMSERRRHRRQNAFRGSIAWLSRSPPTYHALVSRLTAQDWLPGAGQALPDGLSPAGLQ